MIRLRNADCGLKENVAGCWFLVASCWFLVAGYKRERKGKNRWKREDRHASGVTRKMEEGQNDGRGTTVTPLA
jgi:hypothetical protein